MKKVELKCVGVGMHKRPKIGVLELGDERLFLLTPPSDSSDSTATLLYISFTEEFMSLHVAYPNKGDLLLKTVYNGLLDPYEAFGKLANMLQNEYAKKQALYALRNLENTYLGRKTYCNGQFLICPVCGALDGFSGYATVVETWYLDKYGDMVSVADSDTKEGPNEIYCDSDICSGETVVDYVYIVGGENEQD